MVKSFWLFWRNMTIVIPSYKRWLNCKTADFLPSAVLAVAESQAEEYKKRYPNKQLIIPDKIEGIGMSIVRNYLLDNIDDDEILMLDDDINYFGYYEKNQLVKMGSDECLDFFVNAFRMTKELGTVLWGLNLQSDKKFYREYSPFSFSSVVLGPCFGLIKDKDIRYDNNIGLKEDYDYCLQVLRKYRKILRFNKFHYSCGHIKVKGGIADFRSSTREIKQINLLRKKWGSKIVKVERKTQGGNVSINPVVIVPIRGI